MLRLFILLIIPVFSATAALAGFCPYEANYRRLDKDAEFFFPGNLAFSLDRHYDSNNHRRGLFGPGWATDFDRHIEIGGDGALLLVVTGQAEALRFYPQGYTRSTLVETVDKLLTAARKERIVPAKTAEADYRRQLMATPELLDTLYRQLLQRDAIKAARLPVDRPWRSREKAGVSLTPTSTGYVLKSDKQLEYYAADGKLSQLLTPAGEGLTLQYDAERKLQEIGIAGARAIKFFYQDSGLVSRITSPGVTIQFHYNREGFLAAVGSPEAPEYRYSYRDRLLTEVRKGKNWVEHIVYQDDGKLAQIAGPRTRFRFAYSEFVDQDDQPFLRTDVYHEQIKDGEVHPELIRLYRYRLASPPFGNAWLAETRVEALGSERRTRFSGPGRPVRTEGKSGGINYHYDALDRLVREESVSHRVDIRYAGQTRNVEQVTKTDKVTDKVSWVHFTYDEYSNLTQALDSTGQSVGLTYDRLGRIMTMTDRDDNCLQLEYNDLSKPISLVAPGHGSVAVTYDLNGEITAVKSDEGHKMALYVTRLFQRLLRLTAQSAVGGRKSAVISPF